MKNLSFRLLLLFVGISSFLVQSCDPDPDPSTGASLTLLEGTDYLSADATIDAGATFTVSLSAKAGESDMSSLKIFEDNVAVETARITTLGSLTTINNPTTIGADDKLAFTWEISIVGHTEEGTHTYDFEVTDANGQKGSTSIDITVEANADPVSVTENGDGTYDGIPGSWTGVNVTATKGGADLTTIAVYNGSDLVTDLSTIAFGDISVPFTENPMALSGDDVAGFTKTVYIKSATSGAQTYKIEVADAGENVSSATFTINFGTAISTTLEGILLNSAGPTGTGGLDLDTGEGTGSTDVDAEIKDLGVDESQPVATNWKAQIAPANNASLRALDLNAQVEGFSFSSVTTVEAIAAAHATAVDLSESATVVVGDMFTVERGGTYYLLLVTAVNLTDSDNGDNYVFSIKY